MNRDKRDKRESEYPVQLESQFVIRMPEEPGKVLSDLIKSGENFKNRLQIEIYDDMRHGQVRLDHWLLQSKIVDLPTIVESWKSIDKKSLYKTADICQMMICKDKFEESTDDESISKNKKKDPLKVDKKYLWPHGVTPPTKNIRKRRFRKTLKKKCAEAPEIEKEVKRLLRADNEAISFTWEVVQEDDANAVKNDSKDTLQKAKGKKDIPKNAPVSTKTSKVEDIFGGALSDSDVDDENINVEVEDSRQSLFDESLSDINSSHELELIKGGHTATKIQSAIKKANKKTAISHDSSSSAIVENKPYIEIDSKRHQQAGSSGVSKVSLKLQELATDLEELKQRRQRTQLEISRLENVTLRQRFQDILKTINKDIIMKEMEYHKLKSRTK